MPRYFQGADVKNFTLTQCLATTFEDLVRQIYDMPIPLPITFAEFQALPKKEKTRLKSIAYIAPCTFPGSPWTGRKIEHAEECNLLFVDIDDSDHARPFAEDPQLLARKLRGLNFVAHHTTSSTPEKPRLRIVVDAAAISPTRYADAVQTIGARLELPSMTKESLVPVQPMYRPTVFADTDPDTSNPVIISVINVDGSRPFRASDIRELDDELKPLKEPTKKPTSRSDTSIEDFLLYHRDPMPEVTLADARVALDHINPDCEYHDWVKVCAALKHQFRGEDEPEALAMFDAWSANGSKYVSPEETAAKWRSFKEQPKGRAPATIRCLMKLAADSGWDSKVVEGKVFDALTAWISSSGTTADTLRREAARKIAAAPMLSTLDEDILVQRVIDEHSKKNPDSRLPKAGLLKELKLQKNLLLMRSEDEKEAVVIPGWARGLTYVSSANLIVRHHNDARWTPESFDRVFGRKLLPTDKELTESGRTITEALRNTPKFKPSDYVLNHLKCQSVDDFTYDPSSPEQIYVRYDGKLHLNTYRQSYKEADRTHLQLVEDLWWEHMTNLIKEPEYRRTIMDWLAYNVQCPGMKIRWVIVIIGAEGCGKTFIIEVLSCVLGRGNVRIISKEAIAGGWNEWATGSQVVGIEEIRVAGSNRHETMNILKPLITNDQVAISERNRATRSVRNVTNYAAFSNFGDSLTVKDESRRWFIVKSPLNSAEAVNNLKASKLTYFNDLFSMITQYPGALRAMFEDWTISDDFAPNGPAPRTKYLDEMVHDTSNEATALLQQAFDDITQHLIRPDLVSQTAFAAYLASNHVKHVSPQYLSSTLRDAGMSRTDKPVDVAGVQQYLWYAESKLNGRNPLDVASERAKLVTAEDFNH